MLEKLINIIKYRYTKYILIITLLLIYFVGYPAFIKFKMSLPVTVKFDIPQITEKQKGSTIDVYIPPELYADRETDLSQHNALGHDSYNILTLLSDDKVLYMTGANCGSIIFDFNKKIAYTISPNSHYIGRNSLLLSNGNVYLFSELYDPKLNKFFPIANMLKVRSSRTSTLLPDGKILIAGGCNPSFILKHSDAELYDPKLNKYISTSNMHADRVGHTATLLKNGKVLIIGGNYKDQPYAELYDYKTGKFYPLGYKGKVRYNHTATLLPDGRVIIIGGINYIGAFDGNVEEKIYSDVEIFDPRTNKFKQVGHLIYPNWEHTSILLKKSNKVFITGGKGCYKSSSLVCNAQLYDLKTNKTSLVPDSSLWNGSALMLRNGNILILSNGYLSGKNRVKLYIP